MPRVSTRACNQATRARAAARARLHPRARPPPLLLVLKHAGQRAELLHRDNFPARVRPSSALTPLASPASSSMASSSYGRGMAGMSLPIAAAVAARQQSTTARCELLHFTYPAPMTKTTAT